MLVENQKVLQPQYNTVIQTTSDTHTHWNTIEYTHEVPNF